MPLGAGTAAWAIALPVQKDNLSQNPSFEYGTLGVAAIQGAGLGSTSLFEQFGAWSAFVTPTSNGTSGAAFSTFTAANGSAYTLSAYVKGSVGGQYMIAVGDSSGLNLLGSTLFTGGGTWQRYAVPYTEASGAVRRLVVRKASGASVGTFYVDAQQIELGSLTTYIDGDQDGCIWNGAPHASTSTRSGQSRSGGSIVALADLGFQVNDSFGVGMPPIENAAQSYAIIDGAQFQHSRAAARGFTLTAMPLSGTSQQDYHITRSRIIDAFKIDAVTPQQPTRFYCTEGLGTLQIDAVYDSGLELGQRNGPMAENVSVNFIANQPYWRAPTQEGTSMGAFNTFGSANWIVSRDPNGVWGTLGPNGTSTSGEVRTLYVGTDQTLLVGGSFRLAGGTAAGNFAQYTPAANAWGSFAGGTISAGFVFDIAQFPNGTILIAGSYATAGGTNTKHLSYWAGAGFGSFGGTASDAVNALAINAYGTGFLGGQFLTLGGTTSPNIGVLIANKLGTMIAPGGTVDQLILGMTIGLDQTLYAGGIFSKAGGTTVNSVLQYRNGAYGSMGGGIQTSGVNAMVTMLNGRIAVIGQFGSISSVVANNVALWNGGGMEGLAQGFGIGLPGNAAFTGMVDQANTLYVAGNAANAGSVVLPDGVAKYIGGAWVPLDIELGAGIEAGAGGSTQIFALAQSPAGTIYMGGDFAGSAIYATTMALTNTGKALAYPTLRLRNLSAGTARVFQLLNTTTNSGIYFNLALQAGENAVLQLTPGQRTFVSSFRGNIFNSIIPGSNLATWNLLPGANNVSFFADQAALEASIYWTPQSWSNDGGTVY